MGLCCNRRKSSEDENLTVAEVYTTNSHIVEFQDISDENLKNLFVKAAEEEDIDTLLKLVHVNISIKVKSDYFKWGWINNPETLGDLSGLEILRIIYNKLVPKEEDEAAVLTDTSPHTNTQELNKNSVKMIDFTKNFEDFVMLLKKIKLVQRSIKLLEADSKTLQDVSIWIFSYLSLNDYTLPLVTHKEILQRFIHHINNYQYNPNYAEHIDSSLQILRNIYVKDLSLRKTFVESGGFQLLYENILQGQQSTIREVLYNIEDLIYIDDETLQHGSVNKSIIKEMVEILLKLNIEKILNDLYEESQKNNSRYNDKGELQRLIYIFSHKRGSLSKEIV